VLRPAPFELAEVDLGECLVDQAPLVVACERLAGDLLGGEQAELADFLADLTESLVRRLLDLAARLLEAPLAVFLGLLTHALALGVDVYAGYGMSESAPLLCLAQVKSADLVGDPEKAIDIRTKAGIPAPLVDIRLVDTDRNEVPHDGHTPGEVVVRAPWLTQGYVDNAEASEQLWAGGYLHTNDIGVIGPGGYLRIVDRIKDVIKTGGEWVSSLQIEDLISQCKGVSEAAVIGVKDDKWGERPLALIIRDAETADDLSDTQIKAHLRAFADAGVISKFGIPDRILFVKTLPKTSVGKIDKKALREKYGKV